MKTWTTPEIASINLSSTANHQSGNSLGKVCKNNPTIPCNAQGNGKGICKNCIYDIANSQSGLVGGSSTETMS